MSQPEFRAWPKTPRLFKNVTITEKIDGTNGALHITPDGEVYAQSRNRMLTREADNFGFAAWAYNNGSALAEILGAGTHYGEWWGYGINRAYSCSPGERYFSLFNANKWGFLRESSPLDSLSVVPVLWSGTMDTTAVVRVAEDLQRDGSQAKPGFKNPEGVCIYHSASNQIFKYPFGKREGRGAYERQELLLTFDAPPKTFKQRVREMFWLVA